MVDTKKIFPYISDEYYKGVVLNFLKSLGDDIHYTGGMGVIMGRGILGSIGDVGLRYNIWMRGLLYNLICDKDYYYSLLNYAKGTKEHKDYDFYQGLFYPFSLVKDDFKNCCSGVIKFLEHNNSSYISLFKNITFDNENEVLDLFLVFISGGFHNYCYELYGAGYNISSSLFLIRRAIFMLFSYLYITNYNNFRNYYLGGDIDNLTNVLNSIIDNKDELNNICIVFK